ncbi:MAG TPA: AgmX/PglI C-terminal domain-containing protein [Kofleriaceae bacterium]|nr:AgmX/PglI C-terminal domain-containing protein [Kofleriaceae bacterium]
MRCPTCGTENTPDSRFCGGCGAKLVPEVSRVAPTAKISDDAPFPPQRYPTPVPAQPYAYSGPASIPPTNTPASIPPNNNPASIPPNTYQAPQGPASIPPNTYRAPSIPPTNAGYASREPSMSMPAMPQTRWGLISIVLLLDIGLAAAGAVMLQKGLARPDPAPASDGSAHAATPPAATTQAAPPPPSPVAAPSPSPAVSASIATVANAAKPDAAKPDAAKDDKPEPVPVQAKKAPPQHEVKNELGAEIELAAARSRGDFDKCYDDASPEIHLKGRIDIAFTVLPDGRTDNPHVVQNDTGSQQLASCLGATIARWAFASHPAKPVLISRPFIYN